MSGMFSRRWAYFDHAAVAPLPAPTRDAIAGWAEQAADDGDMAWPGWERRVGQLRQALAAMLNADAAEIAMVPNTTTGISLIAEGFSWQSGDNVVTLANEFPSNLYPWMNLASRGVETRPVPVDGVAVDLTRLAAACDARTRILAISWVGYATGWRIDLEAVLELAHQRGILVFLDAIQGLGVFPLDVARTPIDFLAADGHKWLLGPEGAGLLYIRSEHLDRLRPLCVGWNSVVHRHEFQHIELALRREAARYEGGSQNMVGIAGLEASMRLLTDYGLSPSTSPIAEQILAFNRAAADRLGAIGAVIVSDLHPRHASGILAFDFPGRDLADVRRRCLQAGVVLSLRGSRLRLAPHAYNNDDDLARLIDVLRNSDG
jgi:cysteine desulfurase/selenocysteine lyase